MTAPSQPYDARAHAAAWRAAGCTVIPVRPDRSKAPAADRWRDLHTLDRPADTDPLFHAALQHHGPDVGIAVLTGSSSGQLELLEIEGPPEQAAALMGQLGDVAARAGLGDLWARIARGYAEASPKGGVHFLYRLAGGPVPGNTKIARRPARSEELNDAEQRHLANRPGHVFGRTTIETRGQGGYVIVAPTPAACSGADGPMRPWSFLAGTPSTIPVLTLDERAELHRLARSLDTMPAPTDDGQVPQQTRLPMPAGGDERPGDRYAAETPWINILGPAGWRFLYEHGGKSYWCRPGKTSGVSATTTDTGGGDPGGLWVFSSSTTFDPETLYTKFGAYAHLEHRGDMSAAARALAGIGTDNVVPLRPLQVPGGSPAPRNTGDPGSAPAANPATAAPSAHPGVEGGPTAHEDVSVPRGPSWAGKHGAQLGAVLDGGRRRPRADLMPVNGGHGLFYRGRTHSLYGESGSGKSMVAQAETARILRETNERVVYVDYESDEYTLVWRLIDMGAPEHAIRNGQFVYIKPEASPYAGALESDQFRAMLGDRSIALVVLDGVTDALMYEQMKFGGPGIDQNTLVTGWARRVLDPIAVHTGAAVITIDHVPKNSEGRGTFAIGAQAKRSVLSGAAYAVEVYGKAPLGRGKVGQISLRPTKDRDGGIETFTSASGVTTLAAVLTFDSTADDGRIVVSVDKPDFAGGRALQPLGAALEARREESNREGAFMANVCSALAAMPGKVATSREQLAVALGGRNAGTFGGRLRMALNALTFLGNVVINNHGGNKPDTVQLVTPYVFNPDSEPEPTAVPPAVEPPPVPSVHGRAVDGHGTVDGPPVVPSVHPSVPAPYVVGAGRTDGRTDGHHDQKEDEPPATDTPPAAEEVTAWSPSAILDQGAPTAVFLAPARADATPPPTPGPLTRMRHDSVLCPCGEVLAPSLVAQGVDRHFGCEHL